MLFHEGASADHIYSAALTSCRYAPAIPLVLWGMSAKMEGPTLEPASADGRSKVLVGGIWMDTLLPLMASSAFPSHTKFFVVESDHRFFESEIDALEAAGLSCLPDSALQKVTAFLVSRLIGEDWNVPSDVCFI